MTEHENIRAMLILDIIGRPAEYLVQNLKSMISEMEKEKGVVVKSSNIKEPTFMKENKEFYTTFAEIEVETEDIMYLAVLMFKYMPAHIEVISPETINVSNNEWGEVLSELVRRLHSYDEVARVMQIQNQELMRRFSELELKNKIEKTEEKSKKKTGEKKK